MGRLVSSFYGSIVYGDRNDEEQKERGFRTWSRWTPILCRTSHAAAYLLCLSRLFVCLCYMFDDERRSGS